MNARWSEEEKREGFVCWVGTGPHREAAYLPLLNFLQAIKEVVCLEKWIVLKDSSGIYTMMGHES